MKKFCFIAATFLWIAAMVFAANAQPAELPAANFSAQLQPNNETPAQSFKTVSSGHNFSTVAKKQTASGQTAFKYVRPSAKERAKRYANGIVGPIALLRTAASAGVSQISDEPEEWENNFKGYARRFGSSFGRNAIRATVIYGLDETLRVDSSFYRKGKGEKFNKRFANALLSVVTARMPSGKRVVGIPRLVGTYTGSIVAYEAWYPNRFDYKDGIRSGTISLGISAAVNLFREFILSGK